MLQHLADIGFSGEDYPGRTFPLGATVEDGGVNFSVYSRHALGLDLLLFDSANDLRPAYVISFDPHSNHNFDYWHMFVPGLRAGQIYAYRAYGPYDPSRGLRFDPEKVLLDPYGRAVAAPKNFDRQSAILPGDNTPYALKSVVVDLDAYDWEGDKPLVRPWGETLIYEMHVGGFTRHPSSGVAPRKRGTYAGLIEKIPYLLNLGITTVELLPVFQFDYQEAPPGLTNYWGYNPVSLFAVHSQYCSCDDPLEALDEFRDMVKALHRAGIEVLLDVVYNHTAEGAHNGPTYCWKGLDNPTYYMLTEDGARYANYSGTGNTLNANHAMVRRMIIDSLRFWVAEMHVDGFRFDLASILSRDQNGNPLANPPIIWDIDTDPVLAGAKLIAEAWDAAGLYQVGSFIGDHWKEWNGKFRDDVRSFVRGDRGMAPRLGERFLASPDLYVDSQRGPERSINFVTAHDGFTLNDLVSYNRKHNWPNKEGNRDGHNDNRSWNCGVEGPTTNPQIERLRVRQIKNFMTITMLSLGAPMILMGDEIRRTQLGNNNAYCQDNEISWMDWTLLEKNREIYEFVQKLIRLRLSLSVFRNEYELTLTELLQRARLEWHGVRLNRPDWSPHSHSLAISIWGTRRLFHMLLNFYWEPLDFELPPAPGAKEETPWKRLIDTYAAPPDDFREPQAMLPVEAMTYRVQPRSIVLLVAEIEPQPGGFKPSGISIRPPQV